MRSSRRTGRPHRRTSSTLVVLLLVFVLVACSGGEPPAPVAEPGTVGGASTTIEAPRSGATSTTRAPVRGGVLSVGVLAAPAGLDPIVADGDGDGGGDEMLAIYDSLVRYDPAVGTYEPRLAQSVVASPDR